MRHIAGVLTAEGEEVTALAATSQPVSTKLTDISGLSYTGNALKVIRVNAGETAYELAANSATVAWGGISGTLTDQTDLVTALNLKANLAGPTFTGTVSGITASMVGLGSVNNTSDAGKPVSTAQQTALDLKANLASPTFTGTPSLPTGTTATTQAAADNSTKLATTAYTDAAVAAVSGGSGLTQPQVMKRSFCKC